MHYVATLFICENILCRPGMQCILIKFLNLIDILIIQIHKNLISFWWPLFYELFRDNVTKAILTCIAYTLQAAFLRACLMASCKPSKSCLCTTNNITGLFNARKPSVPPSTNLASNADGRLSKEVPSSVQGKAKTILFHN